MTVGGCRLTVIGCRLAVAPPRHFERSEKSAFSMSEVRRPQFDPQIQQLIRSVRSPSRTIPSSNTIWPGQRHGHYIFDVRNQMFAVRSDKSAPSSSPFSGFRSFLAFAFPFPTTLTSSAQPPCLLGSGRKYHKRTPSPDGTPARERLPDRR